MMHILKKAWDWAKNEDGNTTIEFVIWFPFFISLVGSSIEASILTTRQVMLRAAVDRVVRDLQLGNLGSPTHAQLKALICNTAGVIPKCDVSLHIEMERVETANFNFRKGDVLCVDRTDPGSTPLLNFTNGTTNDLMLITVCAAVHPMVPVTGLGMKLPRIKTQGGEDSDHYAIVAFSAYVVEPV